MGYELRQVRTGVWELVPVEKPAAPATATEPKEAIKASRSGLVTQENLSLEQRQTARAAATKRLMRDLLELQKNPLPTVNAAPLENDLFEWHGNLLATSESIFCGLVYHIVMKFPDTYPLQPPRVEMKNYVRHPNIFGGYICLDMLETGYVDYFFHKIWLRKMDRLVDMLYSYLCSGATSEYLPLINPNFMSASSYDNERDRIYAEDDINRFVCSCGHRKTNIYPPIAAELIEREIKERRLNLFSPPKTVPKKKPPTSLESFNFATASIRHGVFMRYREESFPVYTPTIKRTAGCGARSTELSLRWTDSEVQRRFRATAVDIYEASNNFIMFEVKFNERGGDPFYYWGEVYPVFDLHRIKEGLSSRAKSSEEILAQKIPFKLPATADTIEFEFAYDHAGKMSGGRRGISSFKISAPYNLSRINKSLINNRAWKLLAVDPHNGKNLLVLNMLSTQYGVHYISSALFFLHTSDDRLVRSSADSAKPPGETTTRETAQQQSAPNAPAKHIKSLAQPSRQLTEEPKMPVFSERPKYVPRPSAPLVISANFGPLPSAKEPVKPSPKGKEKEAMPDLPKLGIAQPEHQRSSVLPPEASKSEENEEPVQSGQTNSLRGLTFYDLPPEMQLHIFSFLSKEDLFTCFQVNMTFTNLALDSSQWAKDELLCFHSKRTDEEDILGIPINFTLYPISPLTTSRPKHDNIESISSPLDLLSYASFSIEGVRRSVWKEPFTHWLPLYLGPQHGKQAIPLCEQMISVIMTKDPYQFKPLMAVEVFTKLMNTMIVSLMSGTTHASEKAMEGYFCFQHWLLVFIERYPQLLDWINDRIENFIKDPEKRIKKAVPSLGEFIPLLSVTDKYQWSDIAEAFVMEVFDRNQKWVLLKYPALGNMKSGEHLDVDKYRILKTFEANQVSLRLVLFHVFFLNNIAKPKGRTVEFVRRILDACYGRPSPRMKLRLQKHTKELQTVDNWVDFFVRMDMPLPTPRQLTRWLRQSVWNSSRKRYHNRHQYSSTFRKPRIRFEEEEEDNDYDPYEDF